MPGDGQLGGFQRRRRPRRRDSSSTFQNCEFTNNSAVDGGALVVAGGKASLFRATFERNVAERNGGAVYAEATRSVEFVSATIEHNAARMGNGGGVFVAGGGRESEMNGARPRIDFRKSILEGNVAVNGGGLAEGCDVDTTFADGVARCPRIPRIRPVRNNSVSDAGGGVLRRPRLPPVFDADSENVGNELTAPPDTAPWVHPGEDRDIPRRDGSQQRTVTTDATPSRSSTPTARWSLVLSRSRRGGDVLRRESR